MAKIQHIWCDFYVFVSVSVIETFQPNELSSKNILFYALQSCSDQKENYFYS